jgi:hypothetical protein
METEIRDRYVELWNEPDGARRRALVESLWTHGGRQVLTPPHDVRAAAADLAMDAAFEVRGHDALERRVQRAFEQFVAPGTHTFRADGEPARLENVVTFRWVAVETAGGAVSGGGREVLLLGDDGRISDDYQFIDG